MSDAEGGPSATLGAPLADPPAIHRGASPVAADPQNVGGADQQQQHPVSASPAPEPDAAAAPIPLPADTVVALPPAPDHQPEGDPPPGELVEHDGRPPLPPSSSDDEPEADSDEDEDQANIPPGPVDPERCTASGAGFSGGTAGTPARLVVIAKDSTSRRIPEGGAYVLVVIEPAGAAAAAAAEPIEATVTDHGDGSYSAAYTVPSKGNYELSVEINGDPIGGSPFPVFFSAPDRDDQQAAAVPAQPAPATAAEAAAAVSTAAAAASATAAAMPIATFPNMATGVHMSLGLQAAHLGVVIPPGDASQLARSVLVGGVSPFATDDALRSVFALCGTIRTLTRVGPGKSFAFVEFGSEREAAAAARMSGVVLVGQGLRVEGGVEARQAVDSLAAVTNPYYAVQMQQVQAFQMMQQQQGALAQHVAHLRAAQYQGSALGPKPAAPPGGGVNGKNAALAAVQALSRRLAGQGGDSRAEGGVEGRRRSRSRSRDRHRERRRSRSREAPDGGRSRTRSRSRRRRSDHRSRSRDRRHKEHKDHRSRDRDKDSKRSRRSKDSRRDRSKDRGRDRDREGSRERRKEAERRRSPGPAGGSQLPPKPATPADELEELLNELGA